MKTIIQWTKIILIGLLVISIAGCGSDTDENIVKPDATIVKDVSLQRAIAKKLNIVPDTAITESDMQELTELQVSRASIWKLTGLEHATNLKLLWLDSNGDSRRITHRRTNKPGAAVS